MLLLTFALSRLSLHASARVGSFSCPAPTVVSATTGVSACAGSTPRPPDAAARSWRRVAASRGGAEFSHGLLFDLLQRRGLLLLVLAVAMRVSRGSRGE